MVEKEIAIKSVKKMNRISEIYTHISTGEVGGGRRGREQERKREHCSNLQMIMTVFKLWSTMTNLPLRIFLTLVCVFDRFL